LLFGLAFVNTNAQQKTLLNLGDFDEKKIHFGFSLGVNTSSFIMESDLSKSDSLIRLEVLPQSGFNLGIVTDLHLGPLFDLRFIPTLSFGERRLEYTFLENTGKPSTVLSKAVESTYLDFPLNLKYRSIRYNNFAAYFVGGFMYSYDLISQKDVINAKSNIAETVIKLDNSNINYQIGVGFDFFLEYFKFSPELKMSYGVNNLIINDNTILSDPITSLRSKIFLLSFTFEG
jgi:hypothetical protein